MDGNADSLRRRIAELERAVAAASDLISTPTLQIRADSADAAEPTSTISPYYQNLNGVDQTTNMLFKQTMWWTLGIAAMIMLVIRVGQLLWAQLRQVSAMTVPKDKQNYWKYSQWSWMPFLKKQIIYAPLFRKRHNRDIRITSAISCGTLPSRLHTIVLFVYLGSNVIYMFFLNWANENMYAFCAELRGRSGTLAMVNMVPLIILAGRNNPLIPLLQISFDTYNLLHRWMGKIVVIETVIHAIAWAIPASADLTFSGMLSEAFNGAFYASGTIGTIVMCVLIVTALSPFRHAWYETFLNSHILFAFIAFACTMIHCWTAHLKGGLPQKPWITAIFILWALDRAARFLRLLSANWSRKAVTYAECTAMAGEVTKVTMELPKYMDIRPGTHAYLRFAGVNPWECHPFSIAWVHHNTSHSSLPTTEKDPLTGFDKSKATTQVSFLIGAQTGMTRKLYNRAKCSTHNGKPMTIKMKAAMEGPYAGHHSLDSYGHAVLFAGSTGITHQMSYIKHLLRGYNNGTSAIRRVSLYWVVREHDAIYWISPWMNEILNMPNRKDFLNVNVFVTRPTGPISHASSTVKLFPGRPNPTMLLAKEMQEQMGAMVVTVCGSGAFADDVRAAARSVQGDSVVDFIEESFTW